MLSLSTHLFSHWSIPLSPRNEIHETSLSNSVPFWLLQVGGRDGDLTKLTSAILSLPDASLIKLASRPELLGKFPF